MVGVIGEDFAVATEVPLVVVVVVGEGQYRVVRHLRVG